MSVEDFQVKDDTTIDNSIIERVFLKMYPQQGTQSRRSNQGIDFTFEENKN